MRKIKYFFLTLSLLLLTLGGATFAVPTFSLDIPKDNDNTIETTAPSEIEDAEIDGAEEVTEYTFKTYEEYFTDNGITNDISLTTIEGDGSSTSPYVMNSSSDFWYASKYLTLTNKHIKLACDIIFNEEVFDDNGNPSGGDGKVYQWQPMMNSTNLSIDGNGFSMRGMYIDTGESTTYYIGLSYYLLDEVKNVCFDEFFIKSISAHIAPIPRANSVSNCISKRSAIKGYHSVGGIVGKLYKEITNCENHSNIYGNEDSSLYIGGVVGEYDKTTTSLISKCDNYGEIRGKNRVGGVVGGSYYLSNQLRIEHCNNYGNVSTITSVAGGIVGFWVGPCNIVYCNNYGRIISEAGSEAAGIVGYSAGGDGTRTISHCKNFGFVNSKLQTGSNAYSNAGIVGQVQRSIVIDSCESYINKNYNNLAGKTLGIIVGSIVAYEGAFVDIINCKAESEFSSRIISHTGSTAKMYARISNCEFDVGDGDRIVYNSGTSVFDISNIKINFECNGVYNINLLNNFAETTVRLSNLLINVSCTSVANPNLLIISSQTKLGNVDAENIIFNFYTNAGKQGYYFGSNFSGFYIDYKTGGFGIRSYGGASGFQGAITENMLINNGYVKKEI